MRNILFFSLFVIGCATPKRPVEPPPAAAEQCGAKQFVACTSGEDCTRSRGKLVRAHACFDHAASACDALHCAHSCNIHGAAIGESSDVFCASNEASSSHLSRCGGYSGWACPENMTCAREDRAFDGFGTCVPAAN
jgi:hypothetical protein